MLKISAIQTQVFWYACDTSAKRFSLEAILSKRIIFIYSFIHLNLKANCKSFGFSLIPFGKEPDGQAANANEGLALYVHVCVAQKLKRN